MYRKDKVIIILLFGILAILVPIIIDLLVLGNSFPSNIDNDSWASFLGSFWGALIGAGCTCWAVIMQKNYADEQRMIDEITGVRPYIVAVHPEYCKLEGKIKLHFAIQNIGLNSACDIMIYAKNYETKQDNEIIQQKFCLTVNSSVEIDAEFDFAETMYYEFRYRDLKSNQYSQEFRYNENTNSFISFEPKRI